MDLRQMGEVGLSAMAEGIAKVREALPDEALARAEETLARAEDALAKDSPLGKQVLGLVSAAAASSEAARERAAEAAAVAKQRAAEAAAAAKEKSAELAAAAKEGDVEAEESRKAFWKVAAGTVVAAAAVGTGYALWRRRKAAQEQADESAWAPAQDEPVGPGLAEVESPEAEDPHLAEEIDEVADELASEIVEAVEGEPGQGEPAGPAEELAPGLADVESAESEDPSFAQQVDAAADELAEDIVEAVEEPKPE